MRLSLDDLDFVILAELENNARITVSELARRLGSPNSTIRDRIRALEENEVIQGYTAIIDPEKLGLSIKAIIQVVRAPSVSVEAILSEPIDLPEITNVQILTGNIDELITIYARDVDHLKEILFEKFGHFPGVINWSTAIVLDKKSFPLTRRFRPQESDQESRGS
ncbi:MAG: Lrp/AsnC family transcriptional regulator [Chloroflexota bacterium]|nr:Lrp/AsnC family transcriptional regulator [Chloroflexota bacterium]